MIIVSLFVLLSVALLIGGQVFVATLRNKRAATRKEDVKTLSKKNAELEKKNEELIEKEKSLRHLVLDNYYAAQGGSSAEPRLALEIKNRVSSHPDFQYLIKGELQ